MDSTKQPENSDLVYTNFNFNKSSITDEESNKHSADTKYNYLQSFFNKINGLRKVKSWTVGTKERKVIFDDAAPKLFNEQIKERGLL